MVKRTWILFLLLCLWLPAGKEALAIKRVAVKDAQHIVQIGKRACLVRPAGKRNILGRLKRTSKRLVLIPAPKKHRAKALRSIRTSRPAKGLAALYVECLKKNWKAHLEVAPQDDFISHGALEGLIAPSEKTYTLTNTGIEPLSWLVNVSQPWITVLPASGTLGAGKSAKLIVSFKKDQVSLLLEGEHKGKLAFSNLTNSSGNTSRSITLTLAAGPLRAGSISQYGITWTFDKLYRAGQFVNGDWWVVPDAPGGTVTVVRVEPAPSGEDEMFRNGSMLNPQPSYHPNPAQGYDGRAYGYKTELSANFPLELPAGASLVSSISRGEEECFNPPGGGLFNNTCSRGFPETVAILTCLSEPAPDKSFRPAYCGTEKVIHSANDMQLELLPSLSSSGIKLPVPKHGYETALSYYERGFQRAWLDHVANQYNQHIHPNHHMPAYGRDAQRHIGDGLLLLCLGDIGDRTVLATHLVQLGLDWYGILEASGNPRFWGTHTMVHGGRKAAILFAGWMLYDAGKSGAANNRAYRMLNINQEASFHEDETVFYVSQTEVECRIDSVFSGVAQGGSANTMVMDAAHPGWKRQYQYYVKGQRVYLIGGTGAGQMRVATDWNMETNVATFEPPWDTAPDATTQYETRGFERDMLGRVEWGIAHPSYPLGVVRDDPSWFAAYRSTDGYSRVGYVLAAHLFGWREAWGHDALFDYQDRYLEVTAPGGAYPGWRSLSPFAESMWDAYRHQD